MSSLNKVLLMGRLGQQPDMRYTPNGQAVTGLRLATNQSLTGPEGERRDMTDWHDIVVWGKQAETVTKYTGKGDLVYVEGRLQTRSWEGADGQKHYRTEVVAEDVRFLGRAAQRCEAEAESRSSSQLAEPGADAQPSARQEEPHATAKPSAQRAEPEAAEQPSARREEPDTTAKPAAQRAEPAAEAQSAVHRAKARATERTTERKPDRGIER